MKENNLERIENKDIPIKDAGHDVSLLEPRDSPEEIQTHYETYIRKLKQTNLGRIQS